jgi:hypothetical protein
MCVRDVTSPIGRTVGHMETAMDMKLRQSVPTMLQLRLPLFLLALPLASPSQRATASSLRYRRPALEVDIWFGEAMCRWQIYSLCTGGKATCHLRAQQWTWQREPTKDAARFLTYLN